MYQKVVKRGENRDLGRNKVFYRVSRIASLAEEMELFGGQKELYSILLVKEESHPEEVGPGIGIEAWISVGILPKKIVPPGSDCDVPRAEVQVQFP